MADVAQVEVVRGCINLETLVLQVSNIEDFLLVLQGHSNLTHLDLNGMVKGLSLLKLLPALSNLTSLKLPRLESHHHDILKALPIHLPKLKDWCTFTPTSSLLPSQIAI